jgi:inner membrane transporter RhtA
MFKNKDKGFIAAIISIFIAILSIQSGASLAKQLFPIVGPEGTTAFRLFFSAMILALLYRPWRYRPSKTEWKFIVLYGTALGTMNFIFYLAIQKIPLGIAVALEFIGPLGLAILNSQKKSDWLWALFAAAGIYLILPVQVESSALPWDGILLAIAAGICWAGYIIFGRGIGQIPGGLSVSFGMIVAAIVVLPFGAPHLNFAKLDGSILLTGLGVALFSSAIPYSFEMVALRKLPTKTFSILMSLEPAFAALAGFVFLSEELSVLQVAGLFSVILASVGTSLTAREEVETPSAVAS